MLVERSGLSWHEETDAAALATSLGKAVAVDLQQCLERQSMASLVVSGGSTPAPVFSYLSSADIDWSNVVVTLADERWVPPGHPDSNESLVRDTLLTDKAAPARFVSLYRSGISHEQALVQVAADISAMPRPFCVVMLGMGGDGHTASLFPDAPASELQAAMSLGRAETVAFMHPPSVSQERITLTRTCLLNAGRRYLHITGEGKRTVLAEALQAGAGSGWQPGLAPVIGLLTEQPGNASVFWSP